MSTFASCWNEHGATLDERGRQLKLNHKHFWRLFILHNGLDFMELDEQILLAGVPDDLEDSQEEAEDDDGDPADGDLFASRCNQQMISSILSLWHTVEPNENDQLLGRYRTYRIRGVQSHTCRECAHHLCSFPVGTTLTRDSTDDEVLQAHAHVNVDHSRVVTSAIIDDNEKITHKVSSSVNDQYRVCHLFG